MIITNTTNSSTITSGALTVNGGIGINNDLTIGGSIKFFGSNSNFVALKAPTTPLGISFTLPSSLPILANSFLMCDTSGNLNFSSTITNSYTSGSVASTVTNITGLSFTSGSFNLLVTVAITNSNTSNNMTQIFQLIGSLSNNSATLWNMSSIAVSGDNTQIIFNITSIGQIQYRGTGVYTGTTLLSISWNTPQTSVGTTNLVSGTNTIGAPNLGNFFTVTGSSFTDNTTAASGTLSNWSSTYIGTPTLNAINANITTTTASSLYIEGPPITGTNETITNKYAMVVASGNTLLSGNLRVTGNLEVINPSPFLVIATAGGTDGALYFGNSAHGVVRDNTNSVVLYTSGGNVTLRQNGVDRLIATSSGCNLNGILNVIGGYQDLITTFTSVTSYSIPLDFTNYKMIEILIRQNTTSNTNITLQYNVSINFTHYGALFYRNTLLTTPVSDDTNLLFQTPGNSVGQNDAFAIIKIMKPTSASGQYIIQITGSYFYNGIGQTRIEATGYTTTIPTSLLITGGTTSMTGSYTIRNNV